MTPDHKAETRCGHKFLARGSVKLGIPDKRLEPPCELEKGHTGVHRAGGYRWGPVEPDHETETLEQTLKRIPHARNFDYGCMDYCVRCDLARQIAALRELRDKWRGSMQGYPRFSADKCANDLDALLGQPATAGLPA